MFYIVLYYVLLYYLLPFICIALHYHTSYYCILFLIIFIFSNVFFTSFHVAQVNSTLVKTCPLAHVTNIVSKHILHGRVGERLT